MILDCDVVITEPTPDFSENVTCLDRLISVGNLAYDPVLNKVAEESFRDSGVGLFLVHSSVFPQYLDATTLQYPLYPTLNRGIANNVTQDTYLKLKAAYEICKQHVTVPYNTVIFNLTKKSVYKHRHTFASPQRVPLDSQVFTLRLTNNSSSDLLFTIYSDDETVQQSAKVEHGQMMRFNGLLPHELTSGNDSNYYGFFLFENWPE